MARYLHGHISCVTYIKILPIFESNFRLSKVNSRISKVFANIESRFPKDDVNLILCESFGSCGSPLRDSVRGLLPLLAVLTVASSIVVQEDDYLTNSALATS